MTPILLIILISATIGLMDKIKFHWDETWFSTLTRPAWLVRWLNPHLRLIETTNRFWVYILNGPIAGLNDCWHFLKAVMLQSIWMGLLPVGTNWIGWMVLCNGAYFIVFELVYVGMFNKKKTTKQYGTD